MPVIEIVSEHDAALPTPVRVAHPAGSLLLKEKGGSLSLPVQADGAGLVVLVPSLKAKEVRRFDLVKAEASATPGGGV